ncbi:unnamed protein product, partial [Iphiclides podalirius]
MVCSKAAQLRSPKRGRARNGTAPCLRPRTRRSLDVCTDSFTCRIKHYAPLGYGYINGARGGGGAKRACLRSGGRVLETGWAPVGYGRRRSAPFGRSPRAPVGCERERPDVNGGVPLARCGCTRGALTNASPSHSFERNHRPAEIDCRLQLELHVYIRKAQWERFVGRVRRAPPRCPGCGMWSTEHVYLVSAALSSDSNLVRDLRDGVALKLLTRFTAPSAVGINLK